jgi:TPR repeat protein
MLHRTNLLPSNDTARLALTQWTRSAAQNNVDALVKVGDYYYHGLGVPDEPENVRWEKAAGYYRSAADTQISALAMWNLGWMYEHGYGVPQVSTCHNFFLLNRETERAVGFPPSETPLRHRSRDKCRSIPPRNPISRPFTRPQFMAHFNGKRRGTQPLVKRWRRCW